MTYRYQTIHSMALFLKRKAIEKQYAISELKKIWAEVKHSDMIKACDIAYNYAT